MSSRRSKRKVRRTCHLCDTKFDSQREQAEHFNGAFHKFMMTIKRTQMSYLENAKTLNEQITETGKKESLIGLEYIYEYAEDSNGVRMYECQLCDAAYQSDEIFFHIVGIRHRVLYLVKHHPIMGIEADFDVQNQASYRKLANNALAIEQTHGRKKINVVNEVYVEKHKPYEDSDSESSSYGSRASSSDSRSVDSRRSVSPVRRAPRKNRRRKHRETNKLRRERRARARLLLQEEDYRRRDDSLSRERDRYLESRRDSLDRPRTQVLDCSADFDARSMHRVSIPATLHDSRDDARVLDGALDVQSRYRELGSVYLSDNRDIPKFQQDTRGGMAWQYGTGGGAAMLPDDRVGSLAQHGVASVLPYQQERPYLTSAGAASALGTTVPPYQQERPFPPSTGAALPIGAAVSPYQQERQFQSSAGSAPPLGTTVPPYQQERLFPPTAGAAPPLGTSLPTPEDAAEDLDLRRGIGVRGGPSLFHDVDHKGSSAAGNSRDHSRRRNRSPDPRDRADRNRSTYLGDCGDIDVRFMLPSGGISFRELKAAHEETVFGGPSSGNLPPWEKKQEKNGDSNTEVCSMEFSDGEPEDFWCNEELFDFLKTYHIGDEEDVQFILKAVKVLSESLVRHKTRKEELQKWILQEKQKLEEEKKVFLQLKKRKEDNIFGTTMKSTELENIKLFKKVTGEKNVTPHKQAAEKPQETVKQPEQATISEKPPLPGTAPAAPKADPKPEVSSAQKVNRPQPKTTSKKASGKAPKVPQPQAQSVNEPLPLTNFQKALVSGSIAPLLEAAGYVTQPQQEAFSKKALVSGLGPLVQQLQRPQAVSNPNPQLPGPRSDNPNLSKEKKPLLGQAPGGYSGAGAGSNPNPRLPGPRAANPNLQGQAPGGYSGAGAGSNLNPRFPGSRMANPNLPGQAPGGYSGAGAGSNPNPRFPGSRMANPNLQGQGPGGYSGAGAGSNPNSRFPGPRMANQNLPGQAPGRFSGPNMRFGQNPQIPGARLNPDPSKQQRPFGGQSAVRNPEQYTQAQWQSQFGGAGESESESQSEYLTDSAGVASDRRQGTLPNQDRPKPGVYPAGILKNRTGNPP